MSKMTQSHSHSHSHSQRASSLEAPSSDGGIRKRVGRACDRCRLKKSKCDGSNPCSRCRADNAICEFGERKKAHDKVYPKGYVEMLEQNLQATVKGLNELYQRSLRGDGWLGDALPEGPNGQPLTHDLLRRLGVLRVGADGITEPFEADLDVLQRLLEEQNRAELGIDVAQHSSPSDSGSDHDHLDNESSSIAFSAPPSATMPNFPFNPALHFSRTDSNTSGSSGSQPATPQTQSPIPRVANPNPLASKPLSRVVAMTNSADLMASPLDLTATFDPAMASFAGMDFDLSSATANPSAVYNGFPEGLNDLDALMTTQGLSIDPLATLADAPDYYSSFLNGYS